MERTIVVGDVHGCREELEDLVQLCGFRPGERLVLAGDLVAKGPDSAGVIARAREWGARAVLGNHDAHVLRVRSNARQGLADRKPVKAEHQLVVDQLQPADWAYLEAMPVCLRLGPEKPGDADTAVVHAGAVPGKPLQEQDPELLITLRSIHDGHPTKKLKGRPWASLWMGPEKLIFGHDAIRGLQQYPFATGLDTGCVSGGRLTAIN